MRRFEKINVQLQASSEGTSLLSSEYEVPRKRLPGSLFCKKIQVGPQYPENRIVRPDLSFLKTSGIIRMTALILSGNFKNESVDIGTFFEP